MSDNEPTVEDYIRELNGEAPKPKPEPVKAEEQEAAATSTDGEDAEAEEEETTTDEDESSEEQEASDSDEESEDEEEEKPKRRRARPDPKKRIRKLVAERNTERDENARLRAERDILLRQLQQQPQQAPEAAEKPQEPQAPRQEDFTDYAEYLEARSAHASKVAVQEALKEAGQQAQAAQKQNIASQREHDLTTKAKELFVKGAEQFEDFEEVAAAEDLPVTEAMTYAMLESDIGHQIQYHLGSNPDEAQRISQLNPVQQVREMALLEASLSAPKAKPRKKTTSAPEPIKPVGGKSAPRSIDEDTMPLDEYMTKFNRRELPSQKPR